MKLGIKVGPQKTSIADLIATHPAFCEVWFDINSLASYNKLFDYLDSNHIETGLHYWGALADGTWSNLAYPDPELIDKSMEFIRRTIDIAAIHQYKYVNIHPGSSSKIKIDMQKFDFQLLENPINLAQSEAIFIKNIILLNRYALQKNLTLIVETVPARVYNHSDSKPIFLSRQTAVNMFELPISAIEKTAAAGIYIANDFGHTASQIMQTTPQEVWKFLRSTTIQLAKATRLIHLGFIVPPYNGTDFHNTLTNPDLDTENAIPNKKQMIELLKFFQNRPEVWILVEPETNHIKNYFLAREILKNAGVFDR
jgi:hypothetical protein